MIREFLINIYTYFTLFIENNFKFYFAFLFKIKKISQHFLSYLRLDLDFFGSGGGSKLSDLQLCSLCRYHGNVVDTWN